MKQSMVVMSVVIAGLLVAGTAFFLYKAFSPQPKIAQVTREEALVETDEALDPSIIVGVTRSNVKDNTVVLSVNGLGGKVRSVAYELSYTSQGIVQGVTSKPVDVTGKDTFVRDDIYLGTCSKNVCRPHTGVKRVSVVLEFTNASGRKSQFSNEYDF